MKTSQIEIEFEAERYAWEHGRRPSGRGSWAFAENWNEPADSDKMIWTPSMMYTEAKRYARDEARRREMKKPEEERRDFIVLFVLP